MTPYSQKDPKWANEKVGKGKETIKQVGCFVTSLAMLVGKTPSEVNKILTDNECFANGNMLASEKAAKALGIGYNGIDRAVSLYPAVPCIAETKDNAKYGIPQHFFVHFPDGEIIDPLDYPAKKKKNTYHVVSYRLFNHPIMEDPIAKVILTLKEKWQENPEKREFYELTADALRKLQRNLGREVTN